MQGVQLDLLQKAFTIDRLPDHLRSQTSDFYHFSPTEECLSLPSDITDTHFRLIVHFDGWEYCVHERKIQTTKPAAERPMFVTVSGQ